MKIHEIFALRESATDLGYTVDAYHGTSSDFTAFRHIKNSHLGFHFASTPEGANDKLKADRDVHSSIQRGDAAQPIFGFDERDGYLQPLYKEQSEIRNSIEIIQKAVHDRAMKTPRPAHKPTSEEKLQLKKLNNSLAEIERRISSYFLSVRPGERIIPVKLKMENPVRMNDTRWDDPKQIAIDNYQLRLPKNSVNAIKKELQKRGYDSIVYRNEVEDVGNDSYIVFSPNQIRCRFAKFNPAKTKSRNIMENNCN